VGSESASKGLEGLSEFTNFDGTETVEIEVLEDLLYGSAFVFGSMSALTDLFEDNVNAFATAGVADGGLIRAEAPGLDDTIDEVVFLLVGHHSVDISVVGAEIFASDATVGGSGAEELAEVVENGFGLLLAGSDSGVSGGVVLVDEGFEVAALGATGNLLPGGLDDSKSLVRHAGLEDVDELSVGDLAVLVVIEVVVDVSKFLTGKEHSELGEELLELKLGKGAVLVSVELLKEKESLTHGGSETLLATNGHLTYQENSLELFKVIDALSE